MAKFTMILTLAAVALVGCSSPAAEPTSSPSAAGGCDPSTAVITWSAAQQPVATLVGVQLITYTDGGAERAVEVTPLDPGVQVSSNDLDAEAWRDTLLDSLARTGQVDENFGAPPVISDTPAGEPTVPVDGQFVVAVEAPLVTVPFSADCGSSTASGVVSAVTGGQSYTFLSCADPVAADATANEVAALEYCSAA